LHFYSTDRHATESYTLSLHDALPICEALRCHLQRERSVATECFTVPDKNSNENWTISLFRVRYLLCVLVSSTSSLSSCEQVFYRSEEHTSELQSRENLVCRLLLEKKK